MRGMEITRLTLPILSLHYLADKGLKYTVDEVFAEIDTGNIFEDIVKKFGPEYNEIRLDGLKLNQQLFPDDHKELVDALQRLSNAVVPEQFGIDNRDHGLLFLAGLLNELIQSGARDIKLKLI